MIFTSCPKSVTEIVGCLHYFNPKIVKEAAIDIHCIFHNNNSLPSSFGKSVFFVHV